MLSYGRTVHDHHGGEVHFLDKAARRRLERDEARDVARRLGHALDAYLVACGDSVVTVGHRYRRIRAH